MNNNNNNNNKNMNMNSVQNINDQNNNQIVNNNDNNNDNNENNNVNNANNNQLNSSLQGFKQMQMMSKTQNQYWKKQMKGNQKKYQQRQTQYKFYQSKENPELNKSSNYQSRFSKTMTFTFHQKNDQRSPSPVNWKLSKNIGIDTRSIFEKQKYQLNKNKKRNRESAKMINAETLTKKYGTHFGFSVDEQKSIESNTNINV